MRHVGERAELVLQLVDARGVHTRERLERNLGAAPEIERLVDHAHAAFTNATRDLEPALGELDATRKQRPPGDVRRLRRIAGLERINGRRLCRLALFYQLTPRSQRYPAVLAQGKGLTVTGCSATSQPGRATGLPTCR